MIKNPWSEGLSELEPDHKKAELREAIDIMYERDDKVLIELLSDYLDWVKTHGES